MSGTILLISHDLGAGGVQRKIADVARYLTTGCQSSDATECEMQNAESRMQNAECSVHVLLKEGPPVDPGERAFFDAVDASVARIHCRPKRVAGLLAVPFPLFCFWYVLTLRPRRIVGFLRGPGILAVILRRLFWWRDIRTGISDDSFPSGAIVEQARGAAHAAALRQLVRAGYAKADWIAVPSEAARMDLITTFSVPAQRITVSRNWVTSTRAEEPTGATARSGAGGPAAVPDGGFDLIYVGRVAPVKNLSLFVEIVRDLRDIRPSVRAAIVGGGPALLDLERQRARFGLVDHIAFAGWQRDVTPWLSVSRLFCLTSHHEGMPIAALEAMARGIPVISTIYPGAEELVQDGETGFLCRDRGEFVGRVMQCLTQESLRRQLGRHAREVVATRHGQESLQRFVELIVRG
jgi:glycosyltransferase involved in cell wall biosynthesis